MKAQEQSERRQGEWPSFAVVVKSQKNLGEVASHRLASKEEAHVAMIEYISRRKWQNDGLLVWSHTQSFWSSALLLTALPARRVKLETECCLHARASEQNLLTFTLVARAELTPVLETGPDPVHT